MQLLLFEPTGWIRPTRIASPYSRSESTGPMYMFCAQSAASTFALASADPSRPSPRHSTATRAPPLHILLRRARLQCLNATRSPCFRNSAKRSNLGVYSYVSAKRESKKIDVISASLISAVPMKHYTTFEARTWNIGQREAGFTSQAGIIPTNVETDPTKATSKSVSVCTNRWFEVLVDRIARWTGSLR